MRVYDVSQKFKKHTHQEFYQFLSLDDMELLGHEDFS